MSNHLCIALTKFILLQSLLLDNLILHVDNFGHGKTALINSNTQIILTNNKVKILNSKRVLGYIINISNFYDVSRITPNVTGFLVFSAGNRKIYESKIIIYFTGETSSDRGEPVLTVLNYLYTGNQSVIYPIY